MESADRQPGEISEEGGRMRNLRKAFQLALDHSFATCSLETMTAAYPSMAPELLATAHRQLERFLRESTAQEFQLICDQRDVQAKLGSLDALAAAHPVAPGETRAPPADRHEPEAMVRGRLVTIKQAEIQRLQAALAEVDEQNRALVREVHQLRQQFNRQLSGIQQAAGRIDALATASRAIKIEDVWSIVHTLDTAGEGNAPRKRRALEAETPSSSDGTEPSRAGVAVFSQLEQRGAVDLNTR